MKDPKIYIVGGGLSAIYAYFGALKSGYKPEEVEVMTNSTIPLAGAVFMYSSPIPWVECIITNILLGDCDTYSLKQWGTIQNTSAHKRFYNGATRSVQEKLYDPASLYPALWSMISRVHRIGALDEDDIQMLCKRGKAVICTFADPEIRMSINPDNFVKIPIVQTYGDSTISDRVVIYNGIADIPWIRKTMMPGRSSTEYPHTAQPDEIMKWEDLRGAGTSGKLMLRPDIHPMTIPLSWEDRCRGNLLRVGRQAIFDPRYLSHQAGEDAERFLRELQ